MEASIREVKNIPVVDLVGNIKTAEDYETFKKTIDDLVEEGKINLILNFADVKFINSSGLGRLILATKKVGESGGALKIVNLSGELKELFSFTRLDTKIPIFESEDDAAASFAA